MTKLSDTQAVILSAASQRDDGAVLPLPETLRIKGGALDKVLGSLKAKGLIEHQGDAAPALWISRLRCHSGSASRPAAGRATTRHGRP